MGDTDNAMSAALAKRNIITFFEKEKNKFNLFKEIIEILEKQNDDFFYIKQNKEKFHAFQDCIIDGHFQWIIDVSNNQKQTEFNSEYTDECSVTNNIFKNFYIIFDSLIEKNNNFSLRSQKILKKYSSFIMKAPK